jgi:hypothetical protein
MFNLFFIKFFIWAGNIGPLMGRATGFLLQAFCAAKAGPKRLSAPIPRKVGRVTRVGHYNIFLQGFR